MVTCCRACVCIGMFSGIIDCQDMIDGSRITTRPRFHDGDDAHLLIVSKLLSTLRCVGGIGGDGGGGSGDSGISSGGSVLRVSAIAVMSRT